MNEHELKLEELQQGIVGALLCFPKQFFKLKNALRPEYFCNPRWRSVITAIWTCADRGVPFDAVNICTIGRLSADIQLELTEIPSHLYTSRSLPHLAKAFAEEIVRAKIIELKRYSDSEGDVLDLLDRLHKVEEECSAILRANRRREKLDMLDEFQTGLLTNARDGIQRIATPFRVLNEMFHGGLETGGFTLLGGLPGTGKTSFMLSLALHAATNGIRVAFIEGEMTPVEILERLNGIATGSDITEIRRGKRYDELSGAFLSRFHSLPFELVPLYERTLESVTDEIRSQVYSDAKLIFVDYLQVFTSKLKSADEFFEIKKTSERLRALALQHGVHLFVATALNRAERQAERLSLNSFYGSSGLGHDCSIGLILSGEQLDDPELFDPIRNVKLQVVKNRNGARGEISLKFHLRSQRFEEL